MAQEIRKRRKRLLTKIDGVNASVNEQRKARKQKFEYPAIKKKKTKETFDLNDQVEDDCKITKKFEEGRYYFNLSSSDIDFIEKLSKRLSISYSAAINLVLRDALNMFKSHFFYVEGHYDNMVKHNLIRVAKE